ncbi:MAG: sigma-70 family RNA polymerase sigma factor [Phycisphaerales bacterium]|nr:sigma-70 family RNA polymerase sigma factor [Phycisphaerales bacterium]
MARASSSRSLRSGNQPLVSLRHATGPLNARERRDLAFALEAAPGFVDSDTFHLTGAEHAVMDAPEPIRRPDVSWYSPYMETVSPAAIDTDTTRQDPLVLTRAQEQVIFHQYNYARLRAGQLRDKHERRALTPRQARELIRWHRIVLETREHIAEINLPLVLAMARRVRPRDAEYGDLIAEGNMALLRAIDKFDADRGFKFSTYACQAILKSFSRWGMKQSRYRDRFPARFDPTMEQSDWPDGRRVIETRESADEVRFMVLHNTADLSDLEQDVLHHRFGLGKANPGCPDGGPMTLAQVGRAVGLTKERVRQIQNRALAKLRNAVSIN